MTTRNERGVALILAMFLMTAMSVLGASMMFLAQTETYASMNYRMMSQSRYAAEASIQKAGHFLLNVATYTLPKTGGTDPMSNYDTTKSPVECLGGACTVGDPIVLSANTDVAANYPVASVQALFLAAANGELVAGSQPAITLTYNATATLLSMQEFESFGGTANVVQTWEITGIGGLKNLNRATVEVVAIIETPKVSASAYAAFATAVECGALEFSGNVTIDSYDSSTMTAATGTTPPTTDAEGGDVGTNGNISLGGSVDVQGNLYSPRSGVGSCEEGSVTALTETGGVDYDNLVQLPKNIVLPEPPTPSPLSVLPLAHLTNANAAACALLGLVYGVLDADKRPTAPATCGADGDDLFIDGHGAMLSLPSVEMAGQTNLVLVANIDPATPPAQYIFNSIDLASQSGISVMATAPTQAVLVNVSGKDDLGADIAIPLDITGGGFSGVNSCDSCVPTTLCATCSAFDASMLQFLYGGTGTVKMKGNAGAAAVFYAPNAAVDFGGTSDLFGSVVGRTIVESGSGNIHYDRRLGRDFYVAGQPMVGSFTWRRF